jgi:hypothetical protein
MNSSRSARKYRTARPNRTKRGPLPRCRQARSVAMDNPRCCAASVSVKAFRDRNSPLASTRFRVILIGDLPAQRRAHKNTRCCSGDFARARRPYWPARSVSRADEGAVPTSGRRSCAPSGVGDDSGIVLPPNTSDIADSDLGSRVVRTLPSANAGHWDGRSPGPTVFSREVRRPWLHTIVAELLTAMRSIEDHRSSVDSALRMRWPRSGGGALRAPAR